MENIVKGFIYIFSNPSYGNLFKVGMTTKAPPERADELSNLTAVPTPFKVEYSIYVENAYLIEALVHRVLEDKGYRVSENREFFNAPIKEIKRTILRFKKHPIIPKTNKFKNLIMIYHNKEEVDT